MIQNKHIIRLSFIGLFFNIVANIVLYRYFMIEEVILKQVANQNMHIANTYKSEVWSNYPQIINFIKKDSFQHLLNNPEFIQFARRSIKLLKNVNSKVVIYDKQGNTILTNKNAENLSIQKYASNKYYEKLLLKLDSYVLSDYFTDRAITEAFQGRIAHSLIPRAIVTDQHNYSSEKTFVESYIPIISSSMGNFSIEGVMAITTDITEQWNNITYLEQKIFFTFIVVFLVFFAVVMYNTNYAQRIINRQFETNKSLEEAKLNAETENLAKTEFLANISHELRTPLNAIIGFSEIIIAETYGKLANKQYKDYIADINNSGKHLLSVINDILDFSKASANKLNVEIIELDLNKLASSSMRFVKPRADKANVTLIEKLPAEHIILRADSKRLKQALLNLLSNAVKFTQEGGTVSLTVKKNLKTKEIYVIVKDNGIGISEKDIPKALSSFGQIDNKLSRKYDGTGLGLPLTKKLIELMNGKFEIISAPGKGTTVFITFQYNDNIQM